MSIILDGKSLANKLNIELKAKIEQLVAKSQIKPKLATILVGNNPASEIYINSKHKICRDLGIDSIHLTLDVNTSKEQIKKEIEKLNNDTSIHGILLQLPLPSHLREVGSELVDYISPLKDVDGLHTINKGKIYNYLEDMAPCTPKGIITLLKHYNLPIQGKEVVIINRSNLVGKPLIFMFLKRNATVTVCHTSTSGIDKHMKRADILVVAVGHPKFVTSDKIKEGAVIIDVGINNVNGKQTGDVDFESVHEKCGAITPNPGGVGPLTVSFLMHNTVTAYKQQLNLK